MPEKKFTIILDSSQIALFLNCPRKWYYLYHKKLIPKDFVDTSENKFMRMGTLVHRFLDIYYRGRVNGESMNNAMDQALAYNPDDDICKCGCAKIKHNKIEGLGLELCQQCKKCVHFDPVPYALDGNDRQTVLNTFRNYCYHYRGDDMMADSTNDIEKGFSIPLYEDEVNLFILEG